MKATFPLLLPVQDKIANQWRVVIVAFVDDVPTAVLADEPFNSEREAVAHIGLVTLAMTKRWRDE